MPAHAVRAKSAYTGRAVSQNQEKDGTGGVQEPGGWLQHARTGGGRSLLQLLRLRVVFSFCLLQCSCSGTTVHRGASHWDASTRLDEEHKRDEPPQHELRGAAGEQAMDTPFRPARVQPPACHEVFYGRHFIFCRSGAVLHCLCCTALCQPVHSAYATQPTVRPGPPLAPVARVPPTAICSPFSGMFQILAPLSVPWRAKPRKNSPSAVRGGEVRGGG